MPKEEDLASGQDSGDRGKTSIGDRSSPQHIQQQQQQHSPQKPNESPTKTAGGAGTPAGADSQTAKSTQDSNAPGTADSMDTDSNIDNPYLREIKMPKLKGGGKKSTSIQAMSSSTKWSF